MTQVTQKGEQREEEANNKARGPDNFQNKTGSEQPKPHTLSQAPCIKLEIQKDILFFLKWALIVAFGKSTYKFKNFYV